MKPSRIDLGIVEIWIARVDIVFVEDRTNSSRKLDGRIAEVEEGSTELGGI